MWIVDCQKSKSRSSSNQAAREEKAQRGGKQKIEAGHSPTCFVDVAISDWSSQRSQFYERRSFARPPLGSRALRAGSQFIVRSLSCVFVDCFFLLSSSVNRLIVFRSPLLLLPFQLPILFLPAGFSSLFLFVCSLSFLFHTAASPAVLTHSLGS